MFCKYKNNTFLTIEHIIPESLGNKAYVLPRGIVCDKCNQYFSKLENYFCHHHISAATKLLYLDKTKKGKPPSLPLQKGEARKNKTGRIKFKQSVLPGKEAEQLSIIFLANDVIIQGSWPLPETDSEKISRFLAKCGIETLYFKEGKLAYEKEFDLVRQYARYGGRNVFIPFLWGKQTQRNIELYICKTDSKKKGTFYFGAIFLPSIVYFIPLNRADEDYAIKVIAKTYNLNIIDKKCVIKRKSPEFKLHMTTRKK